MVKTNSGDYVISENELKLLLENSFKLGMSTYMKRHGYRSCDAKGLSETFETSRHVILEFIDNLFLFR